MPTHAEKKVLPYTPRQLYDLVVDVDKYPEFLPWCIATRVKERTEYYQIDEMVIGYKFMREKFVSHVKTDPDNLTVEVEYLSGPMKALKNYWKFIPTEDGQCLVDFWLDFEFQSKTVQKMMDFFFNEAVKRMVSAFEKHAEDIYKYTHTAK